ncbi:AAA family ATPase [Salinigranum sp. GCM10025319]|uniref:AAA family ATPase n=1 Tax=Salinigranum sp. GCM10025319 TaxID=3252687 RepID=UPI00360BAB13
MTDWKVIGTVGLPGSGKGEAASVAEEAGIPVVTMGDVVRKETEERGLPPEDHGKVARALREANGPEAIARRSIPMVKSYLADNDRVVVDGLRSGVEVDCFEEAFGDAFTLVSIEAPFEVRAARLADRGRDLTDEDRDALLDREQRELDFGMDEAMGRADIVINNTDSLSAFRERVRTVLDIPEPSEATAEADASADRPERSEGSDR